MLVTFPLPRLYLPAISPPDPSFLSFLCWLLFAFSLYSICCSALLFLYLGFHLCWVFLCFLSFSYFSVDFFWMTFLCFPCLLFWFPSQWLRWLLASWVPLPLSLPWPWGFSSAGWLIHARQLPFPPPRHDSKNFLLYFFNYYSFLYFFVFCRFCSLSFCYNYCVVCFACFDFVWLGFCFNLILLFLCFIFAF